MRNVFFCFISLIFLNLNSATPLPTDERIRYIMYNPSEVYSLALVTGYDAGIQFGDTEEVVAAAFGNSGGWNVKVENGNILTIKPSAQATDTNLRISTIDEYGKRKIYFFDIFHKRKTAQGIPHGVIYWVYIFHPEINPDIPLQVIEKNITDEAFDISPIISKPEVNIKAAEGKSANETQNKDAPNKDMPKTENQESKAPVQSKTSKLNYKYSYAASKDNTILIPKKVYDNDQNTFIELPSGVVQNYDISVNVLDSQGYEVPIKYELYNINYIVFAGKEKIFVIRGKSKKDKKAKTTDHVCVYNENLGKK